MSEHEDLIAALKDLKNELVQHRRTGHAKPWYERSPFKEALAHGMTATVAIILVAIISTCTGKPVPVELAKGEPAAAPPEASASTVAAVATVEPVQAEGPLAPPASAAPVASVAVAPASTLGAKAKRPSVITVRVEELSSALAFAPAPPPPLPSSSAKPPPVAAPAAAAPVTGSP